MAHLTADDVESRVWLCELGGNPFNLPMPPQWWLQLLLQYDPTLAIMPSRKDCAYRLVQKVPREKRLGLNKMIIHTHPDTTAMIRYGVVPVATVPTWAVRSDKIIRDLQRSDIQRRFKSGKEMIADVERREREEEQRQDAAMRADLDLIGGEALKSLRYRTGQTISMRERNRGRKGTTADTAATRTLFGPPDRGPVVDVGSSSLSGPRIVLAST